MAQHSIEGGDEADIDIDELPVPTHDQAREAPVESEDRGSIGGKHAGPTVPVPSVRRDPERARPDNDNADPAVPCVRGGIFACEVTSSTIEIVHIPADDD